MSEPTQPRTPQSADFPRYEQYEDHFARYQGPGGPPPYPVLYIDRESEPFPTHGTEWPGRDDADE